MVEGKSATTIKYLVCFFNFIFVITGLAFIIVGALVELRARDYLILVGEAYVSTAILLIILGVIIFVIAFVGCCGAWRENLCLVQSFAVFLIILFIMELAGGIAAYAYRNKLDDILADNVEKVMEQGVQSDNTTKEYKHWSSLEKKFDCCGFKKDHRYTWNSTFFEEKFCCETAESSAVCDAMMDAKRPCYDEILSFFQHNIGMIGGAGIGVAVVEVLGIIFACCLAQAIKKGYETV